MNKKEFSTKQENTIASFLNLDVVVGSGNRNFHSGDVINQIWLGECKTHVEPTDKIIFDFSVWRKIVEEAASIFKQPILFVDDGTQKLENTWCLIKHGAFYYNHSEIKFPNKINKTLVFSNSAFKQERSNYQYAVVWVVDIPSPEKYNIHTKKLDIINILDLKRIF